MVCRTQLSVSLLLYFIELTWILWYREFLLWCLYNVLRSTTCCPLWAQGYVPTWFPWRTSNAQLRPCSPLVLWCSFIILGDVFISMSCCYLVSYTFSNQPFHNIGAASSSSNLCRLVNMTAFHGREDKLDGFNMEIRPLLYELWPFN